MRLYSSPAPAPVLLVIAFLIVISTFLPPAGSSQTASPSRQEESLRLAVEQLLRQPPSPPTSTTAALANPSRAENEPPADDALIEELIAYWSRRGLSGKSAGLPEPSNIVRERLLSAAERSPWILPRLYEFLPQNTDTHDRLYKTLNKDPGEFDYVEDNNWRVSLYWWLQSNTQYLRSELIEAVRTRDNNDGDKLDEIEALAKLDLQTAKPLLEKIVAEGRSLSYPTALASLYEGAMKGADITQADAYREILKRLAGESGAQNRQTVLKSLLKSEWIGQEEWFISLFDDPKLSHQNQPQIRIINTGRAAFVGGVRRSDLSAMRDLQRLSYRFSPIPISIALSVNTGKWIRVIAGLTNHKEANVRSAAISSLVALASSDMAEKKDREEAARALMPWLTNPDWASMPGRADFIFSLSEIDLPESLPGLLWALNNAEDDYTRGAVIGALTRHCDPRMAPALKGLLSTGASTDIRWEIVTALAKCGGFSDDEMASSVEAFADMAATSEGQATIKESLSGESGKTLPLNTFIGQVLFESGMKWTTEGAASILFDRLKELRPPIAKLILSKIRFLPLNIARLKLVERIGNGSADLIDLKLALLIRETLAGELRAELSDLVKKGGYAGGIAAAALGDQDRQTEILKGADARAQIALLAAARSVIEKLPIDPLKDLIAGSDKTLAQAVEDYLDVEGSAAARKLILGRRPDELKILGNLSCLASYQNELGELKSWEEKLRGEVSTPGGADEIYALAPAVPSRRMKGMVIRVRRGKAEISVYDAVGGRKARPLSDSEFRELKNFTSRPEVEDLGPESWRINKPIVPYEYLHLTKEGGKRVILAGYGSAPRSPSPHERLADLFYRIGKS
jgi:HEAT repeats